MKNITILLLLVMMFSLSGCVSTAPVQDSTEQPVVTETPPVIQPEVTPEPEPKPQTGYAVTADLIFEIAEAMQKVITDLAQTTDKTPYGKFGDPINGMFKVFSSFTLTNTRKLSEAPKDMDGVLTFWKEDMHSADAQLFHDAPHNYRITGTYYLSERKFEIICRYDPETGALQAMCSDNGNIRDTLEFVPLGGDRYALLNLVGDGNPDIAYADYEKVIVTYRDGKILEFHYASMFTARAYRCIYPNGPNLDESWFDEDYYIKITKEITYDGTKLTY